MPEIREIIRTCDDLKRRRYFSEQACAELLRPMAEHVLDRTADGGWDLRPLQFGPPRVVDATNPAFASGHHSIHTMSSRRGCAFALARHWPRTAQRQSRVG